MSFSLPALGYDFNALEPAIDEATMKVHHGKHHQGYTDKLNAAIAGSDLEAKSIEEILGALSSAPTDKQGAIRNNGGGFYNHSLFWQVLAPESDASEGDVAGDLVTAIEGSFGSLSAMKEQFEQKALTQFGSGWAWLVSQGGGKLVVASTPNQDNPLMGEAIAGVSGTPILGLDVWEHAYYLKYQNKRPEYVKNFWSIVNWKRVGENLSNAEAGNSVIG